jgi:hypothetical protein
VQERQEGPLAGGDSCAIQPSIAANEPEKPPSSMQSVIMGTDGKSSETILQSGSVDLAFNHQEVAKK